ncbi:hypothetical protein ACWDZ6_30850 [Streptomyces sp. NPDC002926]
MKRRAWLTVGAVVLGGAGVVTIAVANPSDPPKKPHQQERAAKLRTLQLDKGGATERELPATGTDPFSLVGIGWDSATVEVKGTAQVRTRNAETGKWSGWQALELDAHRPDGAEATAHGASEPLWVGPSTGVQVRVDSGKALPRNLKLHMVDPGVSSAEAKNPAATVMDNAAFAVDETPSASPGDPVTPTAPASPTDTAAPTDSATPTSSPTDTAEPTAAPTVTPSPTPTKPTAPPSTVKQPPIIGRAQWGADEAMVDDPAGRRVGRPGTGHHDVPRQDRGLERSGLQLPDRQVRPDLRGPGRRRRPAGQGCAHLRIQQLLHRHRSAR